MNFATGANYRDLVNMDHVVSLKRRPTNYVEYDALDASGNVIDRVGAPETSAIVPNVSPVTLIQFNFDDDAVQTERYIVIAWRVEGLYVTPITPDSDFNDANDPVYCLEQRFGDRTTFMYSDGCIYATLREVSERARRDLTKQRQRYESEMAEAKRQQQVAEAK